MRLHSSLRSLFAASLSTVVGLDALLSNVSCVQAADRSQNEASAVPAGASSLAGKLEKVQKVNPPASPVQVRGSGDTNQVVVATQNKTPRFTVERISSPDRLVIDLEGEQLAPAPLTTAAGTEFVRRVRIAQHPNKTRVVVDLQKGQGLAHKASTEGGVFVLTLSKAALPASSSTVVNKAQATEQVAIANTTVKSSAPAVERAKVSASEHTTAKVEKASAMPKAQKEQPKEVVALSVVSAPLSEKAEAAKGSSKQSAPVAIAAGPQNIAADKTAQKRLVTLSPREIVGAVVVDKRPEMLSKALVGSSEKISSAPISSKEQNSVQQAASANASLMTAAQQPLASDKVQMQPVLLEAQSQKTKKDEQLANTLSKDAATTESSKSSTVDRREKATGVVQTVALEGAEKSTASVVVGLQGASEYTMKRTAPSEYVLTLRDTTPAESVLKQTLFTSRDNAGIRSVRTTVEGDNTLVRIFTQPSSYLTTRRVGNKVFIEETQDLTRVARDIRAQMAPAAAKEGDAPAKAEKMAEQLEPAKMQELASNKKKSKPDAASKTSAPATKEQAGGNLMEEGEQARASESEYAAMKAGSSSYTGRLISLDLQDADIDSALRIIAEVSNLNIVAGDGVVGKVTLKLVDVPWDQALEVILKSHGLDKVLEGNVLRVAPVDKLKQERESFKQARVAEEELEPLSVKYIRVSYAKASEIKALVETVLSERGSVAFDERSNQLVVKDVRKGLQNVTELIKKVDLRTPQILLETQIVEAGRNLSRELGSELGFQYIQSPSTGNGTGLNFPSAISVGGSVDPGTVGSITGAAFPAATAANLGSAVTMLFDSADGTKSLSLRLSQLEQEGQVRIVSKPAVATTNNKPAEIKSVEKFRVKLPNGGLSIATGSGAQSSGSGDVATQTIEAGIVLNVTPQASPDYYILLDIKAKSSSFGAKVVDGIPNEIERSASSSVLVSSGQTFALGGIYKIMERDNVSGVPFFKDIPVLGTFFRNTTTENTDEELLFFITPRIVEGSFEDASMKIVS